LLPPHWQFDWIERYVDTLPSYDVPSYIVTDTRLAWRGRKNLEISVAGRNLTNGYYPEFSMGPFTGMKVIKVGPEVYGQVTWRY
jgi:outer membrane receptor protein involved in Fe transport